MRERLFLSSEDKCQNVETVQEKVVYKWVECENRKEVKWAPGVVCFESERFLPLLAGDECWDKDGGF